MPNKKETLVEVVIRFLSKFTIQPNGCWEWNPELGTDKNGYGRFALWSTEEKAHRFMWWLTHGSLPNGKHIHHICENESCVNPDHLAAVDPIIHITELTPGTWSYVNKRKTHCPKGHPYSSENTRIEDGSRICIQCARQKCRDYYQKNREKERMRKKRVRSKETRCNT